MEEDDYEDEPEEDWSVYNEIPRDRRNVDAAQDGEEVLIDDELVTTWLPPTARTRRRKSTTMELRFKVLSACIKYLYPTLCSFLLVYSDVLLYQSSMLN